MTAYDAFISYGQDADAELAEALQTGLQRLAKPWRKRRALEVFRDATGMSASPDLRGTLLSSLQSSRFVVLLASPDSAASPWVNDELRTFVAQEDLAWQRIIVVLTGGEWKWAGDGTYTADSTAVPKALVGVFATEPLYVDMRWAKGRKDLTLADAKFKAAVADIASPIRGISEDELIGEDVRQFKLAKRLRWSAVIGLSLLLVASLIASAVAVSKGREAVRQKNAAQEQTKRAVASEQAARAAETSALESAAVARSGELATSALAMKGDDPGVAAVLAVESLYPNGETEMRRSAQADNAVGVTSRALLSRLFVPNGSMPAATNGLVVAEVDRFVATISPPDGSTSCWPAYRAGVGVPTPITWWDRDSGAPVDGVPPGVALPLSFMNVDSDVVRIDDARTVTPIAGRPVMNEVLAITDSGAPTGDTTATGATLADLCMGLGSPATYDPATAQIVAFDDAAGEFVAVDAATGAPRSRMSQPGVTNWADVAVADGIVFATTSDAKVVIWSLAGGGSAPSEQPFQSVWVEAAGHWVAASGSAARLDISTGGGITPVSVAGDFERASVATFSEDQRFLAETDGTDVEIWQLVGNDATVSVASLSLGSVRDLFWSGHELTVVSARGTEFYSFREQPPIADAASLALSPDGSRIAVLGVDQRTVSILDSSGPSALLLEQFVLDDQLLIHAMQLSPDGRLLVTTEADVIVRDVSSGAVLFDRPSAVAAFDPSGRYLAVLTVPFELSTPNSLEIVDTADWSTVVSTPWGDKGYPRSVGWLSDDRVIAVGYDGTVRSARLGDGALRMEDVSWPSAAGGLWVTPDRQLMAAADSAGRLVLWSLEADGAPALLSTVVAGTYPVTDVSFNADHTQMITSADAALTMWDLSDQIAPRKVEPLDRLPVLLAENGTVGVGMQTWFSGDGRSILVDTGDYVVTLSAFDPAAACAAVSATDIARAEAIIGSESACRRIAALQPAG